MNRYAPSRQYLSAGFVAIALALFSGWCGLSWAPAFIPAFLFLVSAAVVLALATRPAIEIHDTHLAVGKRVIPWSDIRRIDRSGWESPLILYITLADERRVVLVYPGDMDSSISLVRHLQRSARYALIDGKPYSEIWGDSQPGKERKPLASPRYRLLTEEDEAEVERLYQRLKTVGHLDTKNSSDES